MIKISIDLWLTTKASASGTFWAWIPFWKFVASFLGYLTRVAQELAAILFKASEFYLLPLSMMKVGPWKCFKVPKYCLLNFYRS